MKEIKTFLLEEIYPTLSDVYKLVGVPDESKLSEESRSLLTEAYALFDSSAKPVGIINEINKNQFHDILPGSSIPAESRTVFSFTPNVRRFSSGR